MPKNRENITKIFLVIFIMSIFISSICFCGHECMLEDCKICYGINLLKSIFDSILNFTIVCLIINEFRGWRINTKYICKIKYKLTPIELKVKLSE